MSEEMFWGEYDPSAEDVYNASVSDGIETAEINARSFGDDGTGLARARASHADKMQSESLKYVHTPSESKGLFARIVDAVLNR